MPRRSSRRQPVERVFAAAVVCLAVAAGLLVGAPSAQAADNAPPAKATATPKEFAKVGKPSITGTAKVGSTVTAKPGAWSPKATFTYQWYRNGKPIAKATKASYKIVATDKGKKLTVKARGTAEGRVATWSKASKAVKVKAGPTYIDVNIKTQRLRYVKNGTLVMEFDIVTGKPNKTPTPTGKFKITQKLSPHKLCCGKKAKYWMRLNKTRIGLHGAPWQEHFGGRWYQKHGSHGCVNLPPADAKKLYAKVKIGTLVKVHR